MGTKEILISRVTTLFNFNKNITQLIKKEEDMAHSKGEKKINRVHCEKPDRVPIKLRFQNN